jgi:hypothetical protein
MIQFEQLMDNKGLLVIGNCGMSRLMSVISSLAEHADMLSALGNAWVAQSAERIAGNLADPHVQRRIQDIELPARPEGLAYDPTKQECAFLKRSQSQ